MSTATLSAPKSGAAFSIDYLFLGAAIALDRGADRTGAA